MTQRFEADLYHHSRLRECNYGGTRPQPDHAEPRRAALEQLWRQSIESRLATLTVVLAIITRTLRHTYDIIDDAAKVSANYTTLGTRS